jgi:hypothetical protein
MPVKSGCPFCQQKFSFPENLAGKTIRCPKCKEAITLPALEPAPAEAAPPEAPPPEAPSEAPAPPEEELHLESRTEGSATVAYKRCPGCGRDLPKQTIICTNCGHNFKTGRTMDGYQPPDPDRTRKLMRRLAVPIFFGIVLIACIVVVVKYIPVLMQRLREGPTQPATTQPQTPPQTPSQTPPQTPPPAASPASSASKPATQPK